MINDIKRHYDELAESRDHFRVKNRYYYSLLEKQYRYFIPEGKKVLEVGCSTGELLNALKPSLGVGIDISAKSIDVARRKFPALRFQAGDISQLDTKEKFDYIVLSGLLGELEDIQGFMQVLRKFCDDDTRVVIEYYSYFWQYLLKFGEKIGAKIPQKIQNWITCSDLCNFLILAGFDPIKAERCIIFPRPIWGNSNSIKWHRHDAHQRVERLLHGIQLWPERLLSERQWLRRHRDVAHAANGGLLRWQ